LDLTTEDASQDTNSDQLPAEPKVIAAIDLGSNSFHMVVANNQDGRLKIIDRIREMVRLSAGLDKSQKLDEEAKQRALACLQRFGQRLRDMHADTVRAIGTNALRRAKETDDFLAEAELALGHPIEIISGIEEARLIYQGTNYAISRPYDQRIVIDIGGGSTELIIGKGVRPIHMESLFMGCVSTSERYFPDGKLSQKNFTNAVMDAKSQLRPVIGKFKKVGWNLEIGTSGTIKAISEAIHNQLGGGKTITMQSLVALSEKIFEKNNVKELSISGVKKERLPVLPGGLAILYAIFESLGINRLNFSEGGLREGVLYDFLGRLRLEHEDVRAKTVRTLEHKYYTDYEQSNRTEIVALMMLSKVRKDWSLVNLQYENYLRWAARLHEIGIDIAHTGYHRHGAYLLQNSDLPGFAWNEQRILACLVGSHRRKIRADLFKDFHIGLHQPIKYLITLLRLAVLLNRDRIDGDLPVIEMKARENSLEIAFPKGWLQEYPLTEIDLQQEKEYLKNIDIALSYS
jgi:exopolyphosphatase/guanosine-5'-triphosphate,3'-diphosphate pyrophosphatase